MSILSDIIAPIGNSTLSSVLDGSSVQSANPNLDLTYPTDFNLDELSLEGSTLTSNIGEKLDLIPYLIELNYYEDIFDNSVSAKLVISDAVGVFKMGGLNGTEKINMKFHAGVGGNVIEHQLHVFSVSDRHQDNSMNFENYTLNLCSKELMTAEKYRVSKSYKQEQISSIVQNVLRNFLKTKKSVSIEQTLGSYDFVLPNKKIYETINWLALYAQPSQGKIGADMLLYENYAGLHFKSLQTLYKQNSIYTYYYNPKNVNNDLNSESENIYRLEIMNNFDTLGATSKGTLSNRLISLDPMLRQRYIKDFNYNDYYKQAQKLNELDVTDINSNKSNEYTDLVGKKIYEPPPNELQSSALRLMMSNSNLKKSSQINGTPNSVQNDYLIEKTIPNRIAQLFLSQYNRLKILVPGNSSIKIGDVITIKIYETVPLINDTKTKQEDIYLNGKYLITAIRHIVNVTRYTTVIEVAKESISNDRQG